MDESSQLNKLSQLNTLLKGEASFSNSDRAQFSTDASAYREKPLGIVWPRDYSDINLLIDFAHQHKIPLIPRGAGTSLAGQVVGNGLVVNTSRYMNSIIEVNQDENWVTIEPGVVLDELNIELAKYGLFFGPETSTSNRCTIGGMVGNNSCGSRSLVYGSTRDHTLEVSGFLANGEEVTFKEISNWEFDKKCQQKNLEGDIYREINKLLASEDNREEIHKHFPHPDIKRRNTGYAVDLLANMQPFVEEGGSFNMAKLIAGSEGTLMLITSIKLHLNNVPPKHKALVCAHFNSLNETFEANLVALKHQPRAVELIDDKIVELSGQSKSQEHNRFFLEGEPAGLLVVEFAEHSEKALHERTAALIADFKKNNLGYSFPVITGGDIKKVWDFRKAGLGVLSNMKGDHKPVAVIEDTAIRPIDLPNFAVDIQTMLKKYDKDCVFYAHVGTGELHLRPILNLKSSQDVIIFRKIAKDTADIVKKYRGSLSGEHGDGRLRGEFIPFMVGDSNYKLLLRVKKVFDKDNILNPEKIIDTPQMNTSLRYRVENHEKVFETTMRWDKTDGMIRAIDKCSGSGDCLKSEIIGGTMCPSYMATRDEKNSTRGRANILREYFAGKLDQDNLYLEDVNQVLQLCLSCKACKSECPSGVDIAKLKAEFLQYYYQQTGVPSKAWLVGNYPKINQLMSLTPWLYNGVLKVPTLRKLIASTIGFSTERDLPSMSPKTLKVWSKWRKKAKAIHKTVYLFADEFTNYLESDIGIKTILLLETLGYRVIVPQHTNSGRTYLSKGLVKKAKKLANKNIEYLAPMVSAQSPLIGIEPSAILTFRDEYPDLVSSALHQQAIAVAKNTYTIEEFLAKEIEGGRIQQNSFTEASKKVKFHGHCYQKALSNTSYTQKVLSFPKNYEAQEIKSGCCGMAGSFGYEKSTYSLSKKVGELVLLPTIRATQESTLISAAGTSCRHQIKDGTERQAQHPVEILYEALK